MDSLALEHILEHQRHPRCRGILAQPDHSYEDTNPLCGDRVRIDVRVAEDRVAEVRWSGQGCAISQAAASMLCEHIEGMPLAEVKAIGREQVIELVGLELGPVRSKCAMLALKTLKAGLYGLGRDDEDDA
jgi:nitrogen fixation NifU-like protein